jgi:SAM-dependent methyltransferase
MNPQCNICGHQGKFLNPHLEREGWHCANCSSSSRNRMVAFALGKTLGCHHLPVYLWPERKNIKILEPCPRGAHVLFFKEKFDYYMPEFDLEKIKAGADPRQYADLQNLSFPDETFDVIIASDVFEHVRDDKRGYQEVHRTLKTGGSFLLTVPYDHAREKTIQRVKVEGDKEVLLMEARYHGGGGSTLTYRDYGRDLLELLRAAGFAVGHVECTVPHFQIRKSSMIICQKSSYFDFGAVWSQENQDRSSFKPLGPFLFFRLFVLFKFNLKSAFYFLREIKRKIAG